MSSYIESSRLSYEDDSLSMSISENQDSLAQSSTAADSMIASTDIGDSSMINSTMTDMNYNSAERLRKVPTGPGGPRFYHKKRFWAMCLAITVVLSAIFIPLLFLVIIPAVAQDAINKSKIDVKVVNITKATNDSFSMSMLGSTSDAGRFGARIDFNGPVHIFYNGDEIGSVEMNSISISDGKGTVQESDQIFTITKKEIFVGFASATFKEKFFTWTLRGSASVRALGMNINNLKLLKDLTIPGSDGFVSTLESLNVTQNPDNTLTLEVHTTVLNPSPIGIELGDMNLQLIYNGTVIANVTAKNVFFHNDLNKLTLIGSAAVPTTDADKFNYIKVMNAYLTNSPINTTAKVISVISPRGDQVDWINEATKTLDLQTTVGGQAGAPQFISNVDFGQVSLKFTPDAPYAPTISSTNATADFQLPFHVDYQILTAQQSVTLFSNGKPVATINVPETNVTTTRTGISLNLPETQMKVVDNDAFSDFLVGFTSTSGSNVDIAGTTSVKVKTFLGDNIPIDGIPFKLSTFLQGFNQFNSGVAPTLSNLTFHTDPTTPGQLEINVDVTIQNTAKYSFSGGSVSLDVIFQENKIGTAVIPNLSIVPGPNTLPVVGTFDFSENGPGKGLLTTYFTGHAVTISIRGNDNSTNIASLVKAFKTINITSTIPPIGQQQIPQNAGPAAAGNTTTTTPAEAPAS